MKWSAGMLGMFASGWHANGADDIGTGHPVLHGALSTTALDTSVMRSAAAAGDVVANGKMVLAWHTNIAPRWLDPLQHDGGATPDNFLNVLHDALIKNFRDQLYDPLALAEHCEFAEDAKSAVFHLRRGIEFHNGAAITPEVARLFPHEFSGGQRQRIATACALATHTRLIVLDQAVSALDVSIRAQIMNQLEELQQTLGVSYLLIGHDLATMAHISAALPSCISGSSSSLPIASSCAPSRCIPITERGSPPPCLRTPTRDTGG